MALVILVVGIVWLSERYAGAAGGYRLRVVLDSVSGLQRGNPVTIRGVKVGKVLTVYLDEGRPVATIGFAEIRALPRDSKVLLKSAGFLGEQTIEVRLGSASEMFADGDLLFGSSVEGLGDLTANAVDAAKRMNRAMDDIVGERNLTRIQNILVQMDSTTAILKRVLEENRSTFSETVDSLAAASADARGILGENREGIRQAVGNLRSTTTQLATTSENLRAASVSLREVLGHLTEVARKVRDGEGTLGRLVNDDGIYRDLQGTLTAVDSLLEAIKRDPNRYFKFSVF